VVCEGEQMPGLTLAKQSLKIRASIDFPPTRHERCKANGEDEVVLSFRIGFHHTDIRSLFNSADYGREEFTAQEAE
jgi:hypothetical protein